MANQPESTIQKAITYYKEIAPIDVAKVMQCAGLEIMRRILGLSQLPLKINLKQRVALLDRAYHFIIN